MTPVVAVSGPSGSGKTRLLARLIPELARRGISVAVVKHTGHAHALDRPGKDTAVFRRAGAVAAAIEGPHELAWFGPPAGGLAALAALMPAVGLVLAEGFKTEEVPRIEVHRRRIAREFLCARDPRVFAIVTDEPPPRPIAAFDPDDAGGVAALLCARFALGGKPRGEERLRVRPTVSSVRPEGSERTFALRRTTRMAKTTNRKSGASRSRGGSRSGASRGGRRSGASRGARRSGASRSAAGRKGGNTTLRTRGPEFYSEIGRKGGKSRGKSTTSRSRKTGGASKRGASRGTSSRGGSRSRSGGGSRRGSTRSSSRSR